MYAGVPLEGQQGAAGEADRSVDNAEELSGPEPPSKPGAPHAGSDPRAFIKPPPETPERPAGLRRKKGARVRGARDVFLGRFSVYEKLALGKGRMVGSTAAPRAPWTGPKSRSELYKTELCLSWEEWGACPYDAKCQFAHGAAELRFVRRHPKYKSEFCREFARTGSCIFGTRCRFAHSPEERALFCAPGPGASNLRFELLRQKRGGPAEVPAPVRRFGIFKFITEITGTEEEK